MADSSIIVRIDGDDSGLQKTLGGISQKAKAGMADIKAGADMVMAAVGKVAAVAKQGIDYNATMESYRTSFEVMTGSAEKAAEVVERLRKMGAETPFETTDLVQTTQLLMQYGFTADDAISKMSMLGDIAQGNKESMNSIALGYAQMSSAGKVNLQDIKQMINGGFNPLQEISDRTSESMASLYDRISKGTMSIDEITESMVHATSEGGKFYQSMEKQSQTLSGQLATLQDNANELLGSVTSGLAEGLADDVLPRVNNMIGELQSAFDKDGREGLIRSAKGMIPDLMEWLVGKTTELASKAPQVAQALFGVAADIVSSLVSMLPELVPTLAEGIINMFAQAFLGLDKLMTGVFDGIEKWFHKGQEKVAGVWVDSENVAKVKLGLDAEIDIDTATENVRTAYATLRAALQTDLLTDEQKNAIIGMIGQDYDAIKGKLMEFGLSDEEAGALATQVTEAGNELIKAYEGLNVGLDATTLARLTAQANGSRIVLKGLLKEAGLDDADIAEVAKVYDEMTGKVGAATPSIMEEIYDKLTDGEPDDEQTVSALKEEIQGYIDGLTAEVEAAYKAKLALLDPMAEDYAEKKAALDEWYNSTKTQITDMNTGMVALVDELAGAPTSVVQARMAEFAEMERTLLGIEDRIDNLNGKAKSAAENAFQVVRSGAATDQATIGLAINLKATQFHLDEQSAEDAYSAAVDELNAKLASGEIGTEEYNAGIESAQGDLEAAKAAAKAAYEKALGEIFAGIAESEGNDAAMDEAMQAANAQELIADFLDNMFSDVTGEIDTEKLAGVQAAIAAVLGDAFGAESMMQAAENMDAEALEGMLNAAASKIDEASADAIETAIGGKMGEAYRSALEKGTFVGTDFDTTEPIEQLAAILSGIAQGAAPAAKDAGQSLGEETTSDMADAEGAQKAGNETVRGLDIALAKAEVAARKRGMRAGAAFAQGYKIAQQIRSPSKVMERLGRYSGEGLNRGLQSAMAEAVRTAQMISGQIVTAADLSQTMRVHVPNLNQEIRIANEQSSVPVNLDGQQIAEIQGLNNAARIGWLRAQEAKGYGL